MFDSGERLGAGLEVLPEPFLHKVVLELGQRSQSGVLVDVDAVYHLHQRCYVTRFGAQPLELCLGLVQLLGVGLQ